MDHIIWCISYGISYGAYNMDHIIWIISYGAYVMASNFRFHKLSYVWTILSCFIFFVFWFVFIFGWLFPVVKLQLKWTFKFRWSKCTGSNMKLTGSRLTSSIISLIVIEWIAAWKFVEQIICYFSKWIDFEIFQCEFQVWLETREIVQIIPREVNVSFVVWFVEFRIRWAILEQKFILQFILQLERIWIDVDCAEK